MLLRVLVVASLSLPLAAQDPPQPQNWNIFFQATSIGQYHPSFRALYSGPLSLLTHPEAEASITWTLFFGLRLGNTQFYFDPEVAGGRGFSGTNGIADFPNGEIPRVAAATPTPYLARLYVTHDFGFSDARQTVESEPNQVAGTRPANRYSITAGRFTVTDFFQNNRYSNDPRTQFMAWGIMYNAAWDYAADTRGYTWGWVHEYHTPRWSLRYGSALMPRVANGERFDRMIFHARSDMFEGEVDFSPGGHGGAVRVLSYQNYAHMGNYAQAIKLGEATGTTPDITATRRIGTLKYGFGLSADQEIRKDIGVFGRLGWNDGKTESFAFTAIDRLATVGVSVDGTRWRRPKDTAGSAVTVAGLSGVHASYLAQGGLDFLIGDGKLNYGRETVWESYYSARVFPGVFATLDGQHVTNPAYNRDRGPVWVGSLRLHIEFGE